MRSWGASKALLPPAEVGESTGWADPISNVPERVQLSMGSPNTTLQAVIVHRYGVGRMGGRGVDLMGLSN